MRIYVSVYSRARACARRPGLPRQSFSHAFDRCDTAITIWFLHIALNETKRTGAAASVERRRRGLRASRSDTRQAFERTHTVITYPHGQYLCSVILLLIVCIDCRSFDSRNDEPVFLRPGARKRADDIDEMPVGGGVTRTPVRRPTS